MKFPKLMLGYLDSLSVMSLYPSGSSLYDYLEDSRVLFHCVEEVRGGESRVDLGSLLLYRREAVEETVTSFEERCFSCVPVYCFERQSYKPKVIKFFTGDHWEMREGSSFSVFNEFVEKFYLIFRKVKPVESFMVVIPGYPDYFERSLIIYSVSEFVCEERISFMRAGIKYNHIVLRTVDNGESSADYIVVGVFIRIFPFSHIGEIEDCKIQPAAVTGVLIWHEPELGFRGRM